MKPSSEHIPFLDSLRGVAILAVFLFHCLAPDAAVGNLELGWHGWLRDFRIPLGQIVTFPLTVGWIGVSIFFVVSGFCIHLSHEKSRDKDLGIFFLRRFFRIYPPYLIALLIFAFVFPWTKLDFSSALVHTRSYFVYSMVSLVTHLALVHNFSSTVSWAINGAFWSIAVEVQLYLLYPLLLVITRQIGWNRALWITGAIELGLRAFAGLTHIEATWLVLNPLFFWFSWTIGAALAEAYLKKLPLPFSGLSLKLFPLLFIVFYMIKPLSIFCFTLAALATVYLMSYWLSNPNKIPSSPNRIGFFSNHLRFAGLISYSFYLIHVPLLCAVFYLIRIPFPGYEFPYLLSVAICAASWFLILIPSYLYYRLIELPSIALGKRVIELRRSKKASPPATPLVVAEP